MTFSFGAIGTVQEAIGQLEAVDVVRTDERGFNAIAHEVRDLIVRYLVAADAGRGHEWRYLIEVSGHSCPGSPSSLKVSVEPHRVPYVPPARAAAGSEAADPISADELGDEQAAAASAVQAARDAREAWNDPDGGDSRDVQ